MSPKHRNCDAGDSERPKQTKELLPLSGKVNILLLRKNNKYMPKLLRLRIRTNLLFLKWWNRKKGNLH